MTRTATNIVAIAVAALLTLVTFQQAVVVPAAAMRVTDVEIA